MLACSYSSGECVSHSTLSNSDMFKQIKRIMVRQGWHVRVWLVATVGFKFAAYTPLLRHTCSAGQSAIGVCAAARPLRTQTLCQLHAVVCIALSLGPDVLLRCLKPCVIACAVKSLWCDAMRWSGRTSSN